LSSEHPLKEFVQRRINEGRSEPQMVAGKVVHQASCIPGFLGGPNQSVRRTPKGRNDEDNRLVGLVNDVSNAFKVAAIPQARTSKLVDFGCFMHR
jgi:hypothetical protein